MELKSYEKPWLPALKGAFLILFGIIAMIQIIGGIKPLAILFAVLIGATGASLIAAGVLSGKSQLKGWHLVTGAFNLAFAVALLMKIDSPREVILWIMLAWIVFYALTELVEAGILVRNNNAFFALFVLNALLTLLFGYFLHVVMGNLNPQSVFYIGIIAFIFGIANILSAYLLSKA